MTEAEITTTTRRPRRIQAVAGAALIAIGVTGLGITLAPSAGADANSGSRHGTMHEMMDAMHGAGTAERMHDVEGGEQMMAECASMMEMMSSMGSMMGRRRAGSMMPGDGMMGGDRS